MHNSYLYVSRSFLAFLAISICGVIGGGQQATAAEVTTLAMNSGNGQSGPADQALASPFRVIALNEYGGPVSGVEISWKPSLAGDTFSAATSVTNSAGVATSTLHLGSTSLLHTATATVVGTGLTQTFTATMWVNGIVNVENTTIANPHALVPYFLGFSYMKEWISVPLFNADNTALVTLYKNLGPGVLRLNAEVPFHPVIWDPSGRGLEYGTVAKADLVRLEGFLQATNWKVLYGIGFAQNSTSAAASEASIAASVFGDNLLGFEIGNEPDVYSTDTYGAPQVPGYTWDDFISTTPVYSNGKLLPSWPIFASAIKAAAPGAALTGPAAGFDWVMPFAQSSQASRISLLTRHIYQGQYSSVLDMATLLTADPRIPVQFPEMAEAAEAAHIPGGYRITECNTYANPIQGVTNGFGAALWTLDFLFDNAIYQSSGVNFQGGGDGVNYSPIIDNGTSVTGVGPDYYAMFAYAQLMKGGELKATQLTDLPSTMTAYAIQETNGSTDIVLNNKNPYSNITVGIARPAGVSSVTSLLLTGPSLTATGEFTFGGKPIQTDGGWSASTTERWPIVEGDAVVTVPAASAQIVHLQ